jgi:hypothetical protein
VQEAANALIDCLIRDDKLCDAERYAVQTFDNLKDHKNGIDQEDPEFAQGAHNLADILCQVNGDIMRAEDLVREALRIRCQLYGQLTWMQP